MVHVLLRRSACKFSSEHVCAVHLYIPYDGVDFVVERGCAFVPMHRFFCVVTVVVGLWTHIHIIFRFVTRMFGDLGLI